MPNRLFKNQTSPAISPTESRLRLQTIIRLRWFAVLGQLIAVCVVYFGLRFQFPIGYCLLFIAASAWLNVYLGIKFTGRHRLNQNFATVLLAYDILQLGALLFLTGGIENPFIVLIVAPVTVSAATLP
ncbi:MAG: sensor histidine kinase, partial [Pseudomonadota bacterium]